MAKNGFSMSNRVAVATNSGSAQTLTADDCGKTLVITPGVANFQIVMPDVAAAGDGWNVTFLIVSGTKNTAVETGPLDGLPNFTASATPAPGLTANDNIFSVRENSYVGLVGSPTGSAKQASTIAPTSVVTGDRLDMFIASNKIFVKTFCSGALELE